MTRVIHSVPRVTLPGLGEAARCVPLRPIVVLCRAVVAVGVVPGTVGALAVHVVIPRQ